MLRNEQVVKLLKICEKLVGKELPQVRGHLSKDASRAPAIWELLVLEAASEIGEIEYEPIPGGSPDIHLQFPNGRGIWIEVAFLYPKFQKEERVSDKIIVWLSSESRRRGIPPYKIYPRFDGKAGNDAGPVRILPEAHERKQFLKLPEIVEFFERIKLQPTEKYICVLSDYTLSISYAPEAQESHLSSGGLVQQAPTTIKKHAVYNVLKKKAKQHDVDGPRIICIGSDRSPALSRIKGPNEVRLEEAIQAAFFRNRSLSATIIVRVENVPVFLEGLKKQARVEPFLNSYSKTPLLPEEIQLIKKLNFNKWKYSSPLPN